jgi:hypothetical protein
LKERIVEMVKKIGGIVVELVSAGTEMELGCTIGARKGLVEVSVQQVGEWVRTPHLLPSRNA